MFEKIYQVIDAIEGTYAKSSDELNAGKGTANGGLIKVKLPDGSLRTITAIGIAEGEFGNEVIISI